MPAENKFLCNQYVWYANYVSKNACNLNNFLHIFPVFFDPTPTTLYSGWHVSQNPQNRTWYRVNLKKKQVYQKIEKSKHHSVLLQFFWVGKMFQKQSGPENPMQKKMPQNATPHRFLGHFQNRKTEKNAWESAKKRKTAPKKGWKSQNAVVDHLFHRSFRSHAVCHSCVDLIEWMKTKVKPKLAELFFFWIIVDNAGLLGVSDFRLRK